MADAKLFDAAEVKKLLRASSGQPIGYAFLLGKSVDDHLFGASKKMPGKRIFQDGKKASGSNRGVFGEASLDGKTLTVTCKGPAAASMEKAIQQWLKKNGMQYAVSLVSAGDAEDEGEGDDGETETDADRKAAPEAKATASAAKPKDEGKDDGKKGAPPAPDEEPEDQPEEATDEQEAEDEDDEGPADQVFDPEFLKTMMRQARREPRVFAFGLGKSRDEDLMAAHRRRTGKRLFAMIKKENSATKGTWGTFTLDGKLLTLTCERKPVPGLARIVKLYFKTKGLPALRIQVIGPDAVAEIEEEGDIDPAALAEAVAAADAAEAIADDEVADGDDAAPAPDAEEAQPAPDAGPDPRATTLAQQFKAMMPELKERATADAAAKQRLTPLVNGFRAALTAGNVDEAAGLMAQLQAALAAPAASAEAPDAEPAPAGDQATPAPEGDRDAAELAALRKRLAPMAKAVPTLTATFPDRKGELEGLYKDAAAALDASDLAQGRGLIAALEQLGSALWQQAKHAKDGKRTATEKLDAAAPAVEQARAAFPDAAPGLAVQEQTAGNLLEWDLVDEAMAEIAELEFIGQLASAAPDDARDMLTDRYNAVWPALRELRDARADVAPTVEAGRDAFFAGLDADDLMAARKALDGLEDLAKIPAAPAPGSDAGAEEAARLDALFKTAAQQWGLARKQVRKDMDTLRAAILATEGADPDIDWIAKQTATLIEPVLNRYDDAFEALLADAVNQNDPERKQGLRQQALDLVRQYTAFADEDFVMTNIGDNDYVELTTQATVKAALGKIEALLA